MNLSGSQYQKIFGAARGFINLTHQLNLTKTIQYPFALNYS